MVPVVLLIVGLVVLVAAIYAAMGGGGELSAEQADYAPLDLGPVSAADVALLRPPTAAWGYDMQATDEALERIADSIRERDVRIVALEQLVTDLSRDPDPVPLGDPFPGARHRRDAMSAAQPQPEPFHDAETRDDDAEAFDDTEPIAKVRAEPGNIAAAPVPQTTMKPLGPPIPWPQGPGQTQTDLFAARSEPAGPDTSQSPSPSPSQERVREPSRQQPPPERSHG